MASTDILVYLSLRTASDISTIKITQKGADDTTYNRIGDNQQPQDDAAN
jgi:hypothetical protein